MKIVVLDGFTLNPGDLSWGALEALGNCVVYDRTTPAKVIERVGNADIVLTNKTPLSAETLRRLPQLRYIGVLATGFNVVDTEAARARGVVVTNVPAYSTNSVAQLTFGLLFELCFRIGHHSQTIRAGRWSESPDFSYWDYPLVELDGLNFGIVGFGRIGQAVAQRAAAFGMRVLVQSRTRPPALPDYSTWASLEEVFTRSDVVSLHCPLTPETRHLVNAERLASMKHSAFLLNTSRGGLVEEQALAQALNEEKIAGAGLDVLSTEPPPAENPLLKARHCVITPHIGWATRSARERLMQMAVDNVQAFLSGAARNVVN